MAAVFPVPEVRGKVIEKMVSIQPPIYADHH
jgi:hypothetical protein